MPKTYQCKNCGAVCAQAFYLRLQLIRCGLKNVKQQKRQFFLPVGHYCSENCVLTQVRSLLGHGLTLPTLSA